MTSLVPTTFSSQPPSVITVQETWNGKCLKEFFQGKSHLREEKYLSIKGNILTPPMLRLLWSKAHGCKDFWKPSKPCHVGIHWKAPTEYFQMSTHVPRFPSFFQIFLHHFVLAKLATSSKGRVKKLNGRCGEWMRELISLMSVFLEQEQALKAPNILHQSNHPNYQLQEARWWERTERIFLASKCHSRPRTSCKGDKYLSIKDTTLP